MNLTGGWDVAVAAAPARGQLFIADAVGVGMLWSTNPSPVAGQGIPFSAPGTPGSWVFDRFLPAGAIYVKGPAGAVLTVVTV